MLLVSGHQVQKAASQMFDAAEDRSAGAESILTGA